MFIMMAKQNFIYNILRIADSPDKMKSFLCFLNILHFNHELELPRNNLSVPVCVPLF